MERNRNCNELLDVSQVQL